VAQPCLEVLGAQGILFPAELCPARVARGDHRERLAQIGAPQGRERRRVHPPAEVDLERLRGAEFEHRVVVRRRLLTHHGASVEARYGPPHSPSSFTAAGSRTTICGVPRYVVTLPVTQMRRLRYTRSGGSGKRFRSSPQITTVKTWFGYGRARLMNVGWPRLRAANVALATESHTVTVEPT